MRNNILYLISAALLLLLATGCRKDLCYEHDRHGLRVRVNMVSEWEQEWERNVIKNWEERWRGVLGFGYDDLRPEAATCIRVRVFTEDKLDNEMNLQSYGGELYMRPGQHDILFYNNDTEYIVFDGEESLVTATASTRTRTRSTYNGRNGDERTVNAPDQLYAAFLPDYTAVESLEMTDLPVQMRPLTYKYVVHFMFKSGLQYVALARGALAGMAEGVFLHSGETTEEPATILFDDCIVDQDLGAYAIVYSFGVPGEVRIPEVPHEGHTFMLNLEVMLKNGKIVSFDFDVTDQVSSQPRGGIIVVDNIEIDDADGALGGGFDVDVDGWGDYEDIELPL